MLLQAPHRYYCAGNTLVLCGNIALGRCRKRVRGVKDDVARPVTRYAAAPPIPIPLDMPEVTIGSSGICENFTLVSLRPDQPKEVRSDLPLVDKHPSRNDHESPKRDDRSYALLTPLPKRNPEDKREYADDSQAN